MANRRTVKLTTRAARQRAHALIDAAPQDWCMSLGEETRTQEQNRLMWPLIADMREQIPGFDKYNADDSKLRFLHELGSELRFLPDLEESGLFPVGQRSSTLSKSQFSALIEIMFAWGARHNVVWSRKSEETRAAIADTRRMAETGTGSVRSTGSGGARSAIAQTPPEESHDQDI